MFTACSVLTKTPTFSISFGVFALTSWLKLAIKRFLPNFFTISSTSTVRSAYEQKHVRIVKFIQTEGKFHEITLGSSKSVGFKLHWSTWLAIFEHRLLLAAPNIQQLHRLAMIIIDDLPFCVRKANPWPWSLFDCHSNWAFWFLINSSYFSGLDIHNSASLVLS